MYVNNLSARNLCLDLNRQVFKQCECNRIHSNCVDTLHTCVDRTYNYGGTGAMITASFLRIFRMLFRQSVDRTVAPPGGWIDLSVVFIATVRKRTRVGGKNGRSPGHGALGWHLICLALRVSSTASRPASERARCARHVYLQLAPTVGRRYSICARPPVSALAARSDCARSRPSQLREYFASAAFDFLRAA